MFKLETGELSLVFYFPLFFTLKPSANIVNSTSREYLESDKRSLFAYKLHHPTAKFRLTTPLGIVCTSPSCAFVHM